MLGVIHARRTTSKSIEESIVTRGWHCDHVSLAFLGNAQNRFPTGPWTTWTALSGCPDNHNLRFAIADMHELKSRR